MSTTGNGCAGRDGGFWARGESGLLLGGWSPESTIIAAAEAAAASDCCCCVGRLVDVPSSDCDEPAKCVSGLGDACADADTSLGPAADALLLASS